MDYGVGPVAAVGDDLARSAARCLAAPEPAETDCASRRRSGAFGLIDAPWHNGLFKV